MDDDARIFDLTAGGRATHTAEVAIAMVGLYKDLFGRGPTGHIRPTRRRMC